MIRITRQTDYGIILLASMAGRPLDRIHTARDVALASHLPLPMVSKILKLLARAGILVSHRGVKGGYSLGLGPREITLAHVIAAMEGPIGMTECTASPGSCDQEPTCPVRVNWQRISDTVREALEKIPLSDMMAASPAPPSLIAVGGPRPWTGSADARAGE